MPPHRPGRKKPRWTLWIIALVALVVVGVLASFMLRNTAVTVVPKSHVVILDQTAQISAYPAGSAATGTLAYTTKTIELEDSAVVAAQGTTTFPPAKASGSITVYNEYSDKPVNLIKNTRFETPDGLIFRSPSQVTVPGKNGSTPGKIEVTVVADANGNQYNIGPVSKFTLPGLKSSPDMYGTVYAVSTGSMSGGSAGGTGPAVAPATLNAAIADLRSKLESKARNAVQALSSDTSVAFVGLMQISYQDKPNTDESDGNVRVHEAARVVVPVFSESDFAHLIASQVSADAESASISFVPGNAFAAKYAATTLPALGADPVVFALTGQAQLIWDVDAAALADALAGRDTVAFETIVNDFPGVEEAHARIEPFWKHSFPEEASSIHIEIETPAAPGQ